MIETNDGNFSEATKPRILVIEDHAATRKIFRALLTSKGYDVELTENGEEGLKAAQHGGFALVLSDLDLPGINGFEVCRKLKTYSGFKEVPVIIMSGRMTEENQHESFRAGAANYLIKPFFEDELMCKIAMHILKT